MSVRERRWQTSKGVFRSAFVVDYADQHGRRRLKTFILKKDAVVFAAKSRIQIMEGTHVPDSQSQTVKQAVEHWLQSAQQRGLERTTLCSYEEHARLHLLPLIANVKLSKITVPFVRQLQDRLHKEPMRDEHDEPILDHTGKPLVRSPQMVRHVIRSLGSIIADAQERGLVAHNAVHERVRMRKRHSHETRHEKRLEIGVDIPTPAEVRTLITHAKGRWRPLFMTAILTGLRASELRGLRWEDVDFTKLELHVRQRADRLNVIGPPKSKAGQRTVPLTPHLAQTLREWKLLCPKKDGRLGLVFPNDAGNVQSLSNMLTRGLLPTMIAAAITVPVRDAHGNPMRDDDGHPILAAKYSGMHAFRHFFASWCINRKVDHGLELPPKTVQTRLGHATISMTMDRYGHLFPMGDDRTELAQGERTLLGL
jgi:integrase